MPNFYPPVRDGLRPTTTAFGRMLREFRQETRISQSEVARTAGFDHSYMSRLEAGSRLPSREAVLTLARVLRLSRLDKDALLMAAGYMPTDTTALFDREPIAGELYVFLTEADAPEKVKDRVRTQVALILEQIDALMKRAETEAA